jgi:hypothetical protein
VPTSVVRAASTALAYPVWDVSKTAAEQASAARAWLVAVFGEAYSGPVGVNAEGNHS